MTQEEIDKQVRELFQKLNEKAKTPEEKGKAIDKSIDLYFELTEQRTLF